MIETYRKDRRAAILHEEVRLVRFLTPAHGVWHSHTEVSTREYTQQKGAVRFQHPIGEFYFKKFQTMLISNQTNIIRKSLQRHTHPRQKCVQNDAKTQPCHTVRSVHFRSYHHIYSSFKLYKNVQNEAKLHLFTYCTKRSALTLHFKKDRAVPTVRSDTRQHFRNRMQKNGKFGMTKIYNPHLAIGPRRLQNYEYV